MEAEGFALCQAPALQTKVFQYRLWDVNQRSLYLRGDTLVAGHLQGANAALEEKVFWVPNRALEPGRLPVILSIRHGSRCLRTERGPGGEPRLRLQVRHRDTEGTPRGQRDREGTGGHRDTGDREGTGGHGDREDTR
uniref:Interleukin-1 receptor antagonist protein n=1 Tax=Taeniopygia guttata TaxID=59729 RepID=A0A674GG65_TAEGU